MSNLWAIAKARNAALAERNPRRAAEIEWFVDDRGEIRLRDLAST